MRRSRVHAAPDDPMRVLLREIEAELNARVQRAAGEARRSVSSPSTRALVLFRPHLRSLRSRAGTRSPCCSPASWPRYRGDAAHRDAAGRLERYPPTCRRLFARACRGQRCAGSGRLRDMAASCKRGIRPRYPGGTDPHNGYTYRRVDPPKLAALVRTAKSWGVTVNDALIAILLRALEPLAGPRPPEQAPTRDRHRIDRQPAQRFPQRSEHDLRSVPELVSRLASGARWRDAQATRARRSCRDRARKGREALSAESAGARRHGASCGGCLSPAQRTGLLRQALPGVGRDHDWSTSTRFGRRRAARLPPPEYLRAVSTGPLAPLRLCGDDGGGRAARRASRTGRPRSLPRRSTRWRRNRRMLRTTSIHDRANRRRLAICLRSIPAAAALIAGELRADARRTRREAPRRAGAAKRASLASRSTARSKTGSWRSIRSTSPPRTSR